MLSKYGYFISLLLLIGNIPISINADNNAIVLDTSIYDPNFNWYNTNGTLPIIKDNTIIFTKNNRTNAYQDAVSLVNIDTANYIELYAKVKFNLIDRSDNDRDEFAIFATSNIIEWDKYQFGFTLRDANETLYAYIQSPDIDQFFIWYPIMQIDDSIHELKAIYNDDKVEFYIDNKSSWVHPLNILDDKLYFVLSSKKFSNMDLSNNYMQVYSASLTSYSIPVPISNNPPIANDDNYTINENEQLIINVNDILANDNDIDNDTIIIVDYTMPSNGILEFNNDTFIYTPNTNYYGNDTFTYTITDGIDYDNASVIINIIQNNIFNVKDYGAKGDGINDDTLAVKAAMEDARVWLEDNLDKQAVIYFPAGIYLLQPFIIPDNVLLKGDGTTLTKIINYQIDSNKLIGMVIEIDVTKLKGINFRDSILTTRNDGRLLVYHQNQPDPSIILQEIKDMGLNSIRLILQWEAYDYYYKQTNDPYNNEFINRIRYIANLADEYGLHIVYDFVHQWSISSWLINIERNAEGVGFPHYIMEQLGIERGTDFRADITTLAAIVQQDAESLKINANDTINDLNTYFWKKFAREGNNNWIVNVNNVNKTLWQHMWADYVNYVVEVTKDHPSTFGYELMNEPFIYVADHTKQDFIGMKNYYQYMTDRIRNVTDKAIFIGEVRRYGDITWSDPITTESFSKGTANAMALPSSYNLIFIMNKYSTTTDGIFTDWFKRYMDDINANVNLPKVIGEWNNNRSVGITRDAFYNTLQEWKNRGYGWFFFSYEQPYPYSLKDKNYNDNIINGLNIKDMLIIALSSLID